MTPSERILEAPFTDVPGAVAEIRAGRMVVVVDDEDRENEGDLTLAAEHVSPEQSTLWPATGGADLPDVDRGPVRITCGCCR